MRVFVTGGSGFLGRRLIARLVREGNDVSGLARSDSTSNVLEELGAKAVRGSLADIPAWASSLRDHDIVIHCAAPVEFWGPWRRFHKEITLASKSLLESSAKAGVKRFIYISSEAVLVDKAPLLDIDETLPYPEDPNSFYGRAKKLAEIELLASKASIQCIILRPTFIWGQGMTAIEKITRKIRSGQFMWIGGGQAIIELVHVDNTVEAILLACKKGEDKTIYFVTDDDPQTAKAFFTALLATRNVTPADKNVPNFIAKTMARMIEGVWKLLGIKSQPPITRFEWSFVALPRKYNISKIKRELGYKPIITREQGLDEMTAQGEGSTPLS